MTTMRTFIAIELEPHLKAHLGEIQAELGEQLPPRSMRWVHPEIIHLTLKFLGDTPLSVVDQVKSGLAVAARQVEPFTFQVGGVGCYPNFRRPRVVWVSLSEPGGALARLRDAIESTVAPLGFPTERRPFSPHLTLGRIQRHASSADVRRVGQVVSAHLPGMASEAALPEPVGGSVAAVAYIKSDLRPTGPVYSTLYEADLGSE